MKKGAKAALLIICAVFLLVACGKKPEAVTASEEIVVPEMSSEDLLVTSLGYLLEEEAEDGSAEEEAAEQEQEEEPDSEDSDMQEEEAELPEATVVYYGASGLKEESLSVEEITPEALVSALARHNIVSLDTKVLSCEEGTEDDRAVLYLDLSKAAGEYLRTMSKEAEYIIVASITDTFVKNYDAEAVYLMIEGEPLATSNAQYIEALEQCTPEELAEMFEASDADETQSKLPLIQEKE
ncbi:MAG: GerMN domain-containing protein [Lachnospiraceae bacterium]|nr:GerMN domain-containing protein [Lachnospiraceae bacterium]